MTTAVTTNTPARWSPADWVVVALLAAMAGWVFLTGITWGLPSLEADGFLFGERRPWSGAEILTLAPQATEGDRGADVDANPITDRRHAVVLNETDEQRAEIVRRYRLYSYQPDEMITFKSLSGMRPGKLDLDPRLYQYGGLWIYPVGGLLKVCSLAGLVDVRSDAAWYLDHPEEFGKFYVVARGYSAAWGIAGVLVVYWLVRKLTGSVGAAAAAVVCYAWMPAVVNAAHEAKPHMAGAVLMLLTVAAAARYVETGSRKWAVTTGALAGASVGMVLSGLWAFAALPVMVMMREGSMRGRVKRLALEVVCGVAVYAVTNPYVVINAAFRPVRLLSNIRNSTAMYAVGGSSNALVNAMTLIAEGATVVVAVVGALGVVAMVARGARRRPREEDERREDWRPIVLLGVVAGIVLVQFVLLAAGKPGEYGRFALVPDICLAIAAVVAIARATGAVGPILRGILLTVLAIAVVPFGMEYVYAFGRDTRQITSRLRAGQELATMPGTIGLRDEPAPYSMPPVNLFDRDLVLLPAGPVNPVDLPVNFTLAPIDGAGREVPGVALLPSRWRRGTLWLPATRIAWANKRFELVPVRGFVGVVDDAVTRTASADSGLR